MAQSLASFLTALSAKVFSLALIVFLVLNGAAIAAFLVTRSRKLVDAWTPKLVAADALLLGAGLGVPLVAGLAKLGVQAISSMLGGGAVTPEP
jgi:hypothetical protein